MSEYQNFQLQDHSSLHKYRTEIPNIILETELDPYELAFYIHLKRIAGDRGACFASNKLLSEKTKISLRKVIICKKELEKKGLIKIKKREKEDGSPDTNLIQITDLWPRNFEYFKEKFSSACGARGVVHVVHEGHACGAHKEEPIKKNHIKNKESKPKKVEKAKDIPKKAVAPAPLASEDAHFLSKYLLKKLKERRSDRKPPKMKTWDRDFDLMIRIDKIPKSKIIEAIDFTMKPDNLFNIQSPASLRKKYDNIADHIVLAHKTPQNLDKIKEAYEEYEKWYSVLNCPVLKNKGKLILSGEKMFDSKNSDYKYNLSQDKFLDLLKNKYQITEGLYKKICSILKES